MKTISPTLNTKRIRSPAGEQNLPMAIVCVFVCDRSVEEEDGEAGLHPSVHQTALDSSLWTKRERESVCACYTWVCVSDKGQWAALSSGDKRPEMKSEDWKDAGPPQELRVREKERKWSTREKERECTSMWKKRKRERKKKGTCGEFHSFSKVYWTAGPEASCWVDLD